MARFNEENREKHRELVRQALVEKPRASLRDIAVIIDKAVSHKFDLHYIIKLVNDVKVERRIRYSSDPEVHQRIAEMEDRVIKLQEELWKIILNEDVYLDGYEIGHPKVTDTAKIKAISAFIKSEKDLLDAQMDAGVFERKLGTVDVEHGVGEFQPVLNAMFNLGMIKDDMPKAKFVEVKEIKPKLLNGPTTTKKQSNTPKGRLGKKLPKKLR